ncbi:MAG: succinylglutamate desuccinylase/aspartoacylase family protein [Thermodesulfobacteriota bacterium]
MYRHLNINGNVIPPGKGASLSILIGTHRSAGSVYLPVCVFRGEAPGPALLITAGFHGDELNGVEALKRMISDGSIMPDAGTVIAVPIANVWGFLNSSRYLPDGKDLNRGFPGSTAGSLAKKIARTIMQSILTAADFGIDLHSGGASLNYPHLRCDTGVAENLELARAFSPPFILNSPLMEGTFRKAAWLTGKNVLVYEGGESRKLSEFAVSECVNGILRLMDYLDMTRGGAPERNDTRVIDRSSWLRAERSGSYSLHIDCGCEVKKGDLLARISPEEGGDGVSLLAEESGYALCVRSANEVRKGDPLINLGIQN